MAAQQQSWLLSHEALQELSETTDLSVWLARCQASLPETKEDFAQLVELAVRILEVGDFQTCWDVAKLFPKLGTAALRQAHGDVLIAPLVAIVEDEEADPDLCWFAARILGAFDQAVVVRVLVTLLKTTEREELRNSAVRALVQLGEDAIAPLSTLLDDANCRLPAVQALSQIQHPATIPLLLSVVQAPETAVRVAAIAALSSVREPAILPALVKALEDLSAAVRREAAIGLGLRFTDIGHEGEAAQAASGTGLSATDVVNWLQPRLWDFDLTVCQQAAIALGRIGTETAVAALLKVLQAAATPLPLRLEAVRALAWTDNPAALDALFQYLQQMMAAEGSNDRAIGSGDPIPEFLDSEVVSSETRSQTQVAPAQLAVSQEIVAVLGRVEQPLLKAKAAQILLELLQSAHPIIQNSQVKQLLALGLGQLALETSLEALIQLLADDDVGVRFHAIAALKHLPAERVRNRLEQIVANKQASTGLQQGVAIALAEWPV